MTERPGYPLNEQVVEELTTVITGVPGGVGTLMPRVYDELRRLAGNYFRDQPTDHTLQPTALVNEAWLRLAGHARGQAVFRGRSHFLAVSAMAMRQILVDHARRRTALKRGGDAKPLSLHEDMLGGLGGSTDILDVNDALQRLETIDERKAQVVELRFFGGLTMDEIADVLDVGKTTVEGDWRMARAWLARELAQS